MNSTIAQIKQIVSRHPDIVLAIVFGSMATGKENRESDLDLAVKSDHKLDANEKMLLITELANVVGRPIDLIDLSTCGEPLLGQILQQGKRIHGTSTEFAKVLYRHLLDEADFVPYQKRILDERRKAWIGL
jgi:predicted nucleotidyltransferase